MFLPLMSCNGPKNLETIDSHQVQANRQSLDNNVSEARSSNSSAIVHIDDATTKVKQGRSQVEVLPPLQLAKQDVVQSDSKLVEAQAQIKVLNDQLDKAIAKIADEAKEIDSLTGKVSTLTKEKSTAIAERDDAKQKYHDAWLGGKTWRLITWIGVISALAIIAGLILNMHTNFFVTPLKIIGWLFTPKS